MKKVLVIGGGAAGMFAAISAAEEGHEVHLFEKNEKCGKKLYITGKGRCNLTNACEMEELFNNVCSNSKFLYSSFYCFTNQDAIAFFEENGTKTKVERGERVFTLSDHSSDVIGALTRKMRALGVQVHLNIEVKEILTEENKVTGLLFSDGTKEMGDVVILATGGCSYPATGSTGDGYRLAARLGHTVAPPTGSLVPLEVPGDDCPAMQGLSLRNVAVRLLHEKGKCLYRDFGELLFTHFGISGPTVLSASAHMGKPGRYCLAIDLKPALEEGKLEARVLRDLEQYKNRSMGNALTDLLPRSMIPVILRRTHIPEDLPAHSLTRQQRHSLVQEMKNFTLEISGKRPVEEAIVTSGGIKTSEVDPKTMASRKVPGLYFAGEILDCDAYTGGFNLQIACSTAFAAAMACLQRAQD